MYTQGFLLFDKGSNLAPGTGSELAAKARLMVYRRVVQDAQAAILIVNSIVELFGDEINITEIRLESRNPDEAIGGAANFINDTYIRYLDEKKWNIVGIAIPDDQYAKEIAARIIRGPKIFVIKRDKGKFDGLEEIS